MIRYPERQGKEMLFLKKVRYTIERSGDFIVLSRGGSRMVILVKKKVLHHPQILVHGGKRSYQNQNARQGFHSPGGSYPWYDINRTGTAS